jgi:uncharacterized membrane protein YqjE
MRETNTRDRPTAELLQELSQEMTTLIHEEVELAKAELAQKGKRAGLGAGMFGAAGVVAFLGIACLTACAIAAIALELSVWLAALIVGLVYLAVAGILALVGKKEVEQATPPVPEQAVESTKEDVAWLKSQAKSVRR